MSSNDLSSDVIDVLKKINLAFPNLNLDETLDTNVEIINDNCEPSPKLQYDMPNFSSSFIPPDEDISEDENSLANSLDNSQNYPVNIEEWDNTHIMKWILELYDKQNYRYEDLNIHFFRDKTGSCLEVLDESSWNKIDNKRGPWLYKEVQCLINDLRYKSIFTSDCGSQPSGVPNVPSPTLQYDMQNFALFIPPVEDISEDENSLANSLDNSQNYPINIEEWDNTHIMKWILELYDKQNYEIEDLNTIFFMDKTGSWLEDLDESSWNKIDNKRGPWLYKEVQCLINDLRYKSIPTTNCGSQPSDEVIQTNVPRKRGRPPKSNAKPRNKEKVGRIWEFLRDLLKDPEYCPRYIRWDNYENLEFRLADPRKICEIWGQKKGKEISYEHFSRSIRHYYNLNKDDPESNKAKILSVDRRLVYKFNKDALEPEDFKQFLKCTEHIVQT